MICLLLRWLWWFFTISIEWEKIVHKTIVFGFLLVTSLRIVLTKILDTGIYWDLQQKVLSEKLIDNISKSFLTKFIETINRKYPHKILTRAPAPIIASTAFAVSYCGYFLRHYSFSRITFMLGNEDLKPVETGCAPLLATVTKWANSAFTGLWKFPAISGRIRNIL